jgi:hypothetical protein
MAILPMWQLRLRPSIIQTLIQLDKPRSGYKGFALGPYRQPQNRWHRSLWQPATVALLLIGIPCGYAETTVLPPPNLLQSPTTLSLPQPNHQGMLPHQASPSSPLQQLPPLNPYVESPNIAPPAAIPDAQTLIPEAASPPSQSPDPVPQALESSTTSVLPPASDTVPSSPSGDAPGTNDLAAMPLAEPPSAPFITFKPYNVGWHELNLVNLEGQKFFRSPAVVSPDLSQMAWTEVTFMPHTRQTFSSLYLSEIPAPPVPVAYTMPQPPPQPSMFQKVFRRPPKAQYVAPPIAPEVWARRFDPAYLGLSRDLVLQIGRDPTNIGAFASLTIVDWSPGGNRLLVQARKGMLHSGLSPSDVVVVDLNTHQTITCTELKNTLASTLNLGDNPAWDITPMGWEPMSDSIIWLRVQQVLSPTHKKGLGMWRYDLDNHLTSQMDINDDALAAPAYGWLAVPNLPPPSSPKHKRSKKHSAPPR